MKKILLGIVFLLFSTSLQAQQQMQADTTAVKTIDGILKEMLRLTSRQKGVEPNWEAYRNLFLPTANFTVLYHDNTFPTPSETVSLDQLIELMNDQYYAEGYTEYELGKVVDEYNGIAQVFQSVYQKDSENMEGKAINSYQLLFFNNRWWIANVIWTTDSNGVKVPKKYLKK